MQPLADRLCGPIDEQIVDAFRFLKRHPQARVRLGGEEHGGGTAVEVAVEQHGRAARPLAHEPGQAGGDGGRADAALHAGHGNDPPAAQQLRRHLARDQRAEVLGDHFAVQRLEEIFEDAETVGQAAVQSDVLAFADGEDPHVGLDQLRQFAQLRERLLAAADIDQQHPRRGGPFQYPCRLGETAARDFGALGDLGRERVAQHRLAGRVGGKGQHRRPCVAPRFGSALGLRLLRGGGAHCPRSGGVRSGGRGRGPRRRAGRRRRVAGVVYLHIGESAVGQRMHRAVAQAGDGIGRRLAIRYELAMPGHEVVRISHHGPQVRGIGAERPPIALPDVRIALGAGAEREPGCECERVERTGRSHGDAPHGLMKPASSGMRTGTGSAAPRASWRL